MSQPSNLNCHKCNKFIHVSEYYHLNDKGFYHDECPVEKYNPYERIIFDHLSKNKRNSWEVYFMKLADLVSTRATCDRKLCGSVIVKDNKIISTGYNGSDPGKEHCDDAGHFMVDGSCKRTIHSEVNAINQAKEKFPSLEGCKIFINTFPCVNCFARIHKEGIKEIFYKDEYRTDQMVLDMAKLYNIKIEKVTL